jgi:glutaredoxin
MLERALSSAGVSYQRRNIWDDAEAAEFVRLANNGNETVPTVLIGTDVYTNPPASFVLEKLGIDPPDGPFARMLRR